MPAPVPDRIGPPKEAGNNVYVYRLAEAPDRALIMISPGSDLADASRHLGLKFGPARVLDVQPHRPTPHAARHQDQSAAGAPDPAPQARPRHRWEKLAVHHYRCTRCGLTKRNRIDPDTHQWFQTYQPPSANPYRSERVPACTAR